MSFPFQAIVFDMDGVLLLSQQIHEAAFREVLAPFRVPFRYADYAGMRTTAVLESVLEANCIFLGRAQLEALAKQKSRIAMERLREENPVAPDALALLSRLQGRCKLGLASSGSRSAVEQFVETNRLRAVFVSVLCGPDVANAKPDPEIYRRSFEVLTAPPSRSLVIEDSVAGVRAAKAAGAVVCGIPNTTTGQDLLASGADRVIARLEDLCSL